MFTINFDTIYFNSTRIYMCLHRIYTTYKYIVTIFIKIKIIITLHIIIRQLLIIIIIRNWIFAQYFLFNFFFLNGLWVDFVTKLFFIISLLFLLLCFQTPVFDVRQRARRIFTENRTALLFGESAIIPFITAVCRYGLNRITDVHCVNRNGRSNVWENNWFARFIWLFPLNYLILIKLSHILFKFI